MENRFFDIDSNYYLNSFYIISLLSKYNQRMNTKRLMIALYLIKYPSICLKLLDEGDKEIFVNNLKKYEFENIESDVMKYSSKLYVDGFFEALSFLYSRELISYDIEKDVIYFTEEAKKINSKYITGTIYTKIKFVKKIISNSDIKKLEENISVLWKE